MIVVCDTSPITNLIECSLLNLIPALYGDAVIPEAVRKELSELIPLNPEYDFRKYDWMEVRHVQNKESVAELLTAGLDAGEAEAIVLADELSAELLLIDERHGARIADERHLPHIGVLGVLLSAKAKGLISEIKPVVEFLRNEVGFWLTDEVVDTVLRLADENQNS